MEFLKELSEIQELYYSNSDIKWIGKHLEKDASIWWRVIRDQISTFEEFKEAFTLKYWGLERQDIIRNNLEYGKFEWHGPITAIQYIERILLESRQLTPTLTDRQLIRKISRHFGRDPVSYTHLDVYKRQLLHRALCNTQCVGKVFKTL